MMSDKATIGHVLLTHLRSLARLSPPMSPINRQTLERRVFWVQEIRKLSGHFGDDTAKLEKELSAELLKEGHSALVDHLRLCGAIPESYGHDSSEEKLYSKYTDALLAESFKAIGLKSLVLKGRADVADVECVAEGYSFVADAKAFRLSRTAKNQKDFKVQAMNTWKRGKPYALVVCPLYQLPARSSQIYQQAVTLDVCILYYAHLAVLLHYQQGWGGRSGYAAQDFQNDRLLESLQRRAGLLAGSESNHAPE